MVSHWTQLIFRRTWALYIYLMRILKFHQHASEVAMKANKVLVCMKRGFIDLNEFVLSRLYK